jgi:hypothetical protein
MKNGFQFSGAGDLVACHVAALWGTRFCGAGRQACRAEIHLGFSSIAICGAGDLVACRLEPTQFSTRKAGLQ